MIEYEAVIGLEVHCQLSTATKIFCGCPTSFGGRPNSRVCPVCLGLPGVLPVLNERVVEYALRLGLALGCRIASRSVFARKNYFYPDVPKDYQISQFEEPICAGGAVPIEFDGENSDVVLTRIHMEEDAGKSIHDQTGGQSTLVDLNRAGVPLLEIVTEPCLSRPQEAGTYLSALRQLVRYLDICDGNMEQGSLRCDANVSLRVLGQEELGTKVELKNMNSISGVVAALQHEIERQGEVLGAGGTIAQETRSWDTSRGVSVFMRGKEHAHDYRYFPDPDLPVVEVGTEWLERVRGELPELPAARRRRLVDELELPPYDAGVLTETRALADYFERVAAATGRPKQASNWMMGELMRLLNERDQEIADFPVGADGLAELLDLIEDGSISGKMAKEVFEEMATSGASASSIVESRGLAQISDEAALVAMVETILDAKEEQVQLYLSGKESLIGFFVGQLMKETRGQAQPQMANRLVREALERRR